MPAYWTQRLQDLIDSGEARIQRLEASDIREHGRTIEAERTTIARLQRTIRALNPAARGCDTLLGAGGDQLEAGGPSSKHPKPSVVTHDRGD